MAESAPKDLSREDRIAAMPPPPEPMRYLYNRTATPWEGMFDGRVYVMKGHEVRVLSAQVAEHLRAHAIIPGTLRRGVGGALMGERYVALGPGWMISGTAKLEDDRWVEQYAQTEAEAEFLVPTETKPGPEYFDRQSIPNYVDRPSMRGDGQPIHPAIVPV